MSQAGGVLCDRCKCVGVENIVSEQQAAGCAGTSAALLLPYYILEYENSVEGTAYALHMSKALAEQDAVHTRDYSLAVLTWCSKFCKA